jgi:hypothetical protein
MKNSLLSNIESSNENQLGYYLAGLIEGDGSIIVPKTTRNEKGKLLYPIIKITFVANAVALANKLMKILQNGTLEYPKNKKYLNLLIQDITTLHKVAILLNGKMRSPKIEALHRLIDWFNLRDNQNLHLLKLGLDTSPLNSNAWLSGFLEADGKFYSNFTIDSMGIATRIKYYMRISQRMIYPKKKDFSQLTDSYFPLMNTIKEFLNVSEVKNITRVRNIYTEHAYEIRTDRRDSCDILINYLFKYPLFSSKYQDFLNWVQIHEINKYKKYKTIEGTIQLINLKNNMNNLRTEFNWDSLKNFYIN